MHRVRRQEGGGSDRRSEAGILGEGGGECSKAQTRLRKQTEQKAPTSRSKKTTAPFNGAERKKGRGGREGRCTQVIIMNLEK